MRIVYNARVIVFTFIAFIFFVSCFAQKGSALDLYNDDALLARLRKNQVLSEKDIIDVKSGYPKLELRGSLQLQYMNIGAYSGMDSISDLYVRRLKLTVLGRLSDKVSIVFEPEYGRGEPAIKDAYLSYKPSLFEIFAGNHLVPFSADALKNDINLSFAERNLASSFSPNRLPGVSILRRTADSRFMVQAGIWNGNINSKAESNLINNTLVDSQIFSSNSGTMGSNILVEAVRIGFNSKGRDNFYTDGYSFENDENFSGGKSFGVGLSYYTSAAVHDVAPTNGLTALNGANAYEADLSFRTGRLSLEFEYGKRNLEWWQYNFVQTSSEKVSSAQTSYSAQASFLLTSKLSLALREESFIYDGKDKVLKGVDGQDQDKSLTVGLNYYFKEQHTKIQANYMTKDETMPEGVTSPKIKTTLLQATMYF